MLRWGDLEGRGRDKKREKSYWFFLYLSIDYIINFIYER